MIELAAAAGWALAALLGGLYLGERGRRLDVQFREKVIRPRHATRPGTVKEVVPAEARVEALVNDDQLNALAEETMALTGCTWEEAMADAKNMVESLGRDTSYAEEPLR